MKFYMIQPPKVLASFVRYFWVLEGNVEKGKPFVHRALADSCSELLFYYKGFFKRAIGMNKTENCFKSGIYGQTQSYVKYRVDEDFGIFGVYLYPYTISQLFSHPASELSNQSPDLYTLFGKQGEVLEEKIILASTNLDRVKLVSEFMIKRLINSQIEYPNIPNVIRGTIHQKNVYPIEELAHRCNLSRRQFERKFREYSGFSPLVFLNIARFGHAINNTATTKSLTEIAYQCGYFDQSHFIRDFRKFSGYSPKEYFKDTQGTNNKATTDFSP